MKVKKRRSKINSIYKCKLRKRKKRHQQWKEGRNLKSRSTRTKKKKVSKSWKLSVKKLQARVNQHRKKEA